LLFLFSRRSSDEIAAGRPHNPVRRVEVENLSAENRPNNAKIRFLYNN